MSVFVCIFIHLLICLTKSQGPPGSTSHPLGLMSALIITICESLWGVCGDPAITWASKWAHMIQQIVIECINKLQGVEEGENADASARETVVCDTIAESFAVAFSQMPEEPAWRDCVTAHALMPALRAAGNAL